MKPIYTLHKLPEGFVVTSGEDIQLYNFYYLPRTNSVYQCNEDPTELTLEKHLGAAKVIAQQDQIDFSALLEEEQKKIGWFDVEKLAETGADNYVLGFAADYQNELETGYYAGYLEGFQKAQELLSDRRFTKLEVLKLISDMSIELSINPPNSFDDIQRVGSNIFQSLSQKSWQVELEMEWIIEGDEEYDEGGTLPGIVTSYQQPKLTNGKITITKIL